MPSRPPVRIGVVPHWEPAATGTPGPGRFVVDRAYTDALLAAGGTPLVLPYDPRPRAARALVCDLDGVVITGGFVDLPPEWYGEAPHPRTGPVVRERSDFEAAVTRAALRLGRPLLGICNGAQVLNVVLGGSLHQHVPDAFPGAPSHEMPPPRDRAWHGVQLTPGSLAARAFGATTLDVNSSHHQAVARAGRGVRYSGHAPDGVVEALEVPRHPFALGVQWHPERLAPHDRAQARVFAAFVRAARARA